MAKPVDPMVMEEFKNICSELVTNDWNKRLRAIDTIEVFVKNNLKVIKGA